MTERTRRNDRCPRLTPFAATATAVDYERVEEGLADGLTRLEGLDAPTTARPTIQHRSEPVWWWRWQLVTWAFSTETERAYRENDLRGFRTFLKSLTDGELAQFLGSVDRPGHDSATASFG